MKKIDAKRLPKWNKHRCKNALQINAKTHTYKDQENHENHVVLRCKGRFILGRYSNFEVLQAGCANGKFIKKPFKMRLKSITKFMKKTIEQVM